MSLEPALDLLVEEPQFHQQDQAGHTQEHVGPQLVGREEGQRHFTVCNHTVNCRAGSEATNRVAWRVRVCMYVCK